MVVGMARSGMAAVELLREKDASVRAVDQNPKPVPGLPLSVEPQSAEPRSPAPIWIVLSPGRSRRSATSSTPPAARGIHVIGDLELASWFLKGDHIGITGSNGKTTTTAFTGHILTASGIPVQVGGNIGRPPASMVATSRPGQWNVLELSSFQLETTETFRARHRRGPERHAGSSGSPLHASKTTPHARRACS